MTTTLTLIYEGGNGKIKVSKPGYPDEVLTKQGQKTEISIHQGSDQVVTVQEIAFVRRLDVKTLYESIGSLFNSI